MQRSEIPLLPDVVATPVKWRPRCRVMSWARSSTGTGELGFCRREFSGWPMPCWFVPSGVGGALPRLAPSEGVPHHPDQLLVTPRNRPSRIARPELWPWLARELSAPGGVTDRGEQEIDVVVVFVGQMLVSVVNRSTSSRRLRQNSSSSRPAAASCCSSARAHGERWPGRPGRHAGTRAPVASGCRRGWRGVPARGRRARHGSCRAASAAPAPARPRR
jgi:hypothetical protein